MKTLTARLGLPQWSAKEDLVSRTDFTNAFKNLEDRVALDSQGALADRPSAGVFGRYFQDTATGALYRDTGTTWVTVGSHLDGLTSVARNVSSAAGDFRALAGQSSDILRVLSGSGSVLSAFTKNGALKSGGVYIAGNGNESAAERLGNASLAATALSATSPAIVAKGFSGQTASVFQVKNSSDSITAYFTAAGDLTANRAYKSVDGAPANSREFVTNKYVSDTYLTISNAVSTYATIANLNLKADASALSSYLLKTDAASTYLTKTDASSTYATKTELANIDFTPYLKKTDAADTYLTKTNASTTYLAQTTATSVYLSKTDATNTYATITNLNKKADSSALSAYLTITSASDTYLSKTDAASLYAPKVHDHARIVTTGYELNFSSGLQFLASGVLKFKVDGNGAIVNGSIPWNSVSSKPTTFTPSTHNHAATDVTSGNFAWARMPVPVELSSTDDLNNFVTPGVYHQSANAETSLARNYPALMAGLLDVRTMGGFVYQTYTTYGNDGTVFYRQRYNNIWSAWVKSALHDDYMGATEVARDGAGKITTVVQRDRGGFAKNTKTLNYSGDTLTGYTEVANGLTITVSLTRNANGEITGMTRSVA